jgi:murein DD-endopeptidase MepM/ murein hydrolase activator NlpD
MASVAVSLISLLITVGTFMPATARASVLGDIIGMFTGSPVQADTLSDADNVQTIALLTPAINSDPSPATDSTLAIADGSAVVPQDGPSGTIADIQKKTQSGGISIYVVRPGDTLSGIAQLLGITPGTILSANDLSAGSKLQVGEKLIILPISGMPYTVKKGDTLESIAKTYGGDAIDIGNYNGIDDSTLVAGSEIVIPNGAETPAVQATVSKKSSSSSGSSSKPVASTKILQGQYASCDNEIPMANNPAEPARGVGPVGTCAEIEYYKSPLGSFNFRQTQNIHGYNAVDLAAPSGTPIVAAAAGEVIVAKQGGYNGGYGSYVVITHDNGSQTLYAHMSEVDAVVGEDVEQGQVIGKVGTSGDSSGAHVHFEIRDGIRNPF